MKKISFSILVLSLWILSCEKEEISTNTGIQLIAIDKTITLPEGVEHLVTPIDLDNDSINDITVTIDSLDLGSTISFVASISAPYNAFIIDAFDFYRNNEPLDPMTYIGVQYLDTSVVIDDAVFASASDVGALKGTADLGHKYDHQVVGLMNKGEVYIPFKYKKGIFYNAWLQLNVTERTVVLKQFAYQKNAGASIKIGIY